MTRPPKGSTGGSRHLGQRRRPRSTPGQMKAIGCVSFPTRSRGLESVAATRGVSIGQHKDHDHARLHDLHSCAIIPQRRYFLRHAPRFQRLIKLVVGGFTVQGRCYTVRSVLHVDTCHLCMVEDLKRYARAQKAFVHLFPVGGSHSLQRHSNYTRRPQCNKGTASKINKKTTAMYSDQQRIHGEAKIAPKNSPTHENLKK